MSTPLAIRVTVLDTWDAVPLALPPETTIAEVKRRALAGSRVSRSASEYVLKYLGAELGDDGATLASAGVAPNGALILHSRRRIPAR